MRAERFGQIAISLRRIYSNLLHIRSVLIGGDHSVHDIAAGLNDVVDDLLRAEQAVRAHEDAQWQPISTAPLDGREVLLRVKMRAGIPGCMLVGHFMQGGHCIEDHPPINRGWYFWNGCYFDGPTEPTYWMPLPPTYDANEQRSNA